MLLDEIRAFLMCFVVLPRWTAETVALWIVHTYAFELRRVATYLGLESPERECGKTTLMTLISKLVNRPLAASNVSSPAFYRAIEELRPTLLIDEADTLLPGNAQLRGILNAGYTREMAYVLRVTSEVMEDDTWPAPQSGKGGRRKGGSRLARFSCWGPKAIAQIGHLPDTLRSRCIVIPMQKKTEGEKCERFVEDKALLETLRRKCLRFALDHAETIATAQAELPKELSDRSAQIWEPLVVLADLAGGDWPRLAREAAAGLSGRATASSPIGALLFDIWLLFTTLGGGRIFSRTLAQGLNSLPDRPWREKRHGKGITEAWLAEQLQPYGIWPAMMRIGQAQARGYCEADFEEAFKRYMSRSEIEALKASLKATATPESREQKSEVSGQKSEVSQEKMGTEDKAKTEAPPSEIDGQQKKDTGETGDEAAAA